MSHFCEPTQQCVNGEFIFLLATTRFNQHPIGWRGVNNVRETIQQRRLRASSIGQIIFNIIHINHFVEKGTEASNFFTSFTHFSVKHLSLFCWNSPTIFVRKPVSFQDFSPPSLSRNICSSSLLVAGSFPVCFQFPHPVARKAFFRSRNVESTGDKNIRT